MNADNINHNKPARQASPDIIPEYKPSMLSSMVSIVLQCMVCVMALHQLLLVVIIFLLFHIDFTVHMNQFITTHDFEAENGVCSGHCKQMMRSAASDGLTVLLRLGDKLHHSVKIKSNCSISVGNCRYSTGGLLLDTINISLANTNVGSFNTISQEGDGHLWNVFKDSGPVGQHLHLSSGHYDLVLFLSVDNLGVEIDKTTLNFNCDADPGLIETNHNGTTMETTTSVGEIVGIVSAVATVVIAAISVLTYIHVRQSRR